MADLESTLHYSLRVELAPHTVIKGEALTSLKKFISVLAKVKIPESTSYTHAVHTHTHTHKHNAHEFV